MKVFVKLVSVILAVSLLFSLGAAAFAEEQIAEETVVSAGYDGLKKIEDRLYEIAYDSIDYAAGEAAFASGELVAGAVMMTLWIWKVDCYFS